MTNIARQAVAIRHVAFEDLGLLGPILGERGYGVAYVEAAADNLSTPQVWEADLVVVLGGPIGAYEEGAYPFLSTEIAGIEKRLAANRPTLGLCLGAQLMARALGAPVYPAGGKEIGWAPVSLTEAGAAGPVGHLAPDLTHVLHWHGDTFDLPEGTERLASTDLCPNQALNLGANVLALQFHLEVTARGLEHWFVGHAAEIAATPGIDVPSLRRDTETWAPIVARQGRTCFENWLSALET